MENIMDMDIGQTPPALPEDNTLIIGTVGINLEQTITELQQPGLPLIFTNPEDTEKQTQKIHWLAQFLSEKGFDIIYIGLFGVSISANITQYNEVFGLNLSESNYKATSHFIDLNDQEHFKNDKISVHFNGGVEYLNTIDTMEDTDLYQY
jgi:hypothetical protein